MKDSKYLLASLLKTTQMGQVGIRSLLDTSMDDSLRQALESQLREYDAIETEAHSLANRRGWELTDLDPAVRFLADRMARARITGRQTDTKIAAMYQTINISQYASGSSVPTLNRNDVHRHSTNIPSLNEQIKIAALLEKIDKRIDTQKKIIEKYESLIRGISNKLLYADNGIPVRLGDLLIERSERTKVNNQHEVLSSTVKGIFSQREYFSKEIASENNVGYKIIHLHDVVLSPQNLWMGNINYNDKYDIGIVSPSYKIFSIAEHYDKRFVSALLKTHRALYNYMLVSEQGASVVRRNLNMEAFEQLVFKMPSIDKQREVGNAISALQSRIELAIRVKTAYEKQKQWLLTAMFI